MNRFGPMFAARIRKRRVQAMRQHTHWRWHLDEVYVRAQGEMKYLWRAVDQEGEAPESLGRVVWRVAATAPGPPP